PDGRRYSPFRRATISTPRVATLNAPSPATYSASVQLPGSRRESIVPAASGGMLEPIIPNVIPRVIILSLLLRLLEKMSPQSATTMPAPLSGRRPGFPGGCDRMPRRSVPPAVGGSAARSVQRQLYLALRAG